MISFIITVTCLPSLNEGVTLPYCMSFQLTTYTLKVVPSKKFNLQMVLFDGT